jgi:hypothetical protein
MKNRGGSSSLASRRSLSWLSSLWLLSLLPLACGGGGAGPSGASGASSGGTNASAGATVEGGGGSQSNGGAGAAGASSGGASASTGGTSAGGGGGGADPGETARVSGWLTNKASGLPDYAYTNIAKNFATPAALGVLAHAIVTTCAEFAPSEANWTLYCEAVLSSAIVAESSYDPSEDVTDSYATRDLGGGTLANDPTVGLLQIRFSSTVQDYNGYGSFEKMAAIGCTWPSELETGTHDAIFWGTQGGTTAYLNFMKDPSCNIGLAGFYYFTNATGNGGPNATYTDAYCKGNGIAGTMIIGLLSHLEGPGFARPADPTNAYVTGIKTRFAALLGGLPSPDPFTESLMPEPSRYCR